MIFAHLEVDWLCSSYDKSVLKLSIIIIESQMFAIL